MTRTWTSDTDTQKPGETTDEQKLRAWFERLPRMRALIRQQQEHIASLRSAATTIPARPATPEQATRWAPIAMLP